MKNKNGFLMKPRERVLKTLRHEEPDRVPKSIEYMPEILERLTTYNDTT
ncbi:MAG: hypothetical protein H5T85_07200, partial [Actinobacteria bacterium]|nr:hypothetical protein [Actinomycetota bacterium]